MTLTPWPSPWLHPGDNNDVIVEKRDDKLIQCKQYISQGTQEQEAPDLE